MTKKAKEVKKEELTIDSISEGDVIPDLHGEKITITDDLIEQMRRFEQEMSKKAIYKNKITGTFLYFKYYEDNPKEVKPKKKPGRKPKAKVEEIEETEELEGKEIVNEEDMLLDAIEDYKAEYGVKTVNTKSQKFKQFYYNWKNSN